MVTLVVNKGLPQYVTSCIETVFHFDLLAFTFHMEMYWANKLVLLLSVPAELAVCRKQLSVSIFAECCCVCGLTEGTAYSLTDSELSSVYYQGFTLRSNYCSSYCWQEWHQRNLYVYWICLCFVGACFFLSYQMGFVISFNTQGI